MKSIVIIIGLLGWMLITAFLAITVIGLILITEDNWLYIPKKLIDKL